MNPLQIAIMVTQFVPAVLQAMDVAETAFPGSGAGDIKRGIVRSILEAAWEIGKDGKVTFAEVWPYIEKLIAFVVEGKKLRGIFKRDQK